MKPGKIEKSSDRLFSTTTHLDVTAAFNAFSVTDVSAYFDV